MVHPALTEPRKEKPMARFETLTEGWSDTYAVVYHVYDSSVPSDWDGEPLGILFSSEDEADKMGCHG